MICSSRDPKPWRSGATHALPLFVLLFATAYFLMERSTANAFSEHLTRLDSVYFAVTVLTTVGFGDIAGRSEAARALVTVQMIADLLLLGFVVRVLLQAAQTAVAGLSGHVRNDGPTASDTGS